VRSVTLDAAERALKEAAQMVDGIAAVLAL
jgi:hypothetical protein